MGFFFVNFVCCRSVQKYIDDLAPSFHVDCLLPRTLLSVMSLEHVEQVFTSMLFPPDACLANVFYFVVTEPALRETVCLLCEILQWCKTPVILFDILRC